MWYKGRFSVSREIDAGKSATGTPIKRVDVVIPDIKGDLLPVKSEATVGEAGRTTISTDKLICPMADIRADDIVTDLTTGKQYKVNSIQPYSLLPRLECMLKGGVL